MFWRRVTTWGCYQDLDTLRASYLILGKIYDLPQSPTFDNYFIKIAQELQTAVLDALKLYQWSTVTYVPFLGRAY